MSKTVIQAFKDFQKNVVNLDTDVTKNARKSRDWLVEKISEFPNKYNDFPGIYSEKNIFFGSFARKTKKRELDDIDLIITIKADGATYHEYSDYIKMTTKEEESSLDLLVDDNSSVINSRKVLNLFKRKLSNIPQYSNSDIKSNKEAVTLNLSSYDWSFDVVPAFFTTKDVLGKNYYIIPDGKGNWKKTDPRMDRDRVTEINVNNNSIVLSVVRIVKFWNSRPIIPTMPSYLLENMILNYYDDIDIDLVTDFVDMEFVKILIYIRDNIHSDIMDPKGIQGNINLLDSGVKSKIYTRADNDSIKAQEARDFEDEHEEKKSIDKWIEIFGSTFPNYK